MKKVARCKAKKVNTWNDIVIEEGWFLLSLGSKLASRFSNRGEKNEERKSQNQLIQLRSPSAFIIFGCSSCELLNKYLAVQSPRTMPMIIILNFLTLANNLRLECVKFSLIYTTFVAWEYWFKPTDFRCFLGLYSCFLLMWFKPNNNSALCLDFLT